MLSRLQNVWMGVRDSLWFLPATMTVASVLLAIGMLRIDRAMVDGTPDSLLIFSGGAAGARGVLSVIAGGLITVTGTVFSITIVALQLASTQFTPRVLRSFTADRANQFVLGVFIGTFTYTLLVLRTVIAADDSPAAIARAASTGGGPQAAFVPNLSVTMAVLLALASMGFLIFFINHAARSIQASNVVDRIHGETLDLAGRLFPERIGEPEDQRPELPEGGAVVVAPEGGGFLQGVDGKALLGLARDRDLVLRIEVSPGDYLIPGEVVATAWPSGSIDDPAREKIQDAFVLGSERTPHQDVQRGIIELADVALKALSPSINDPTTAMICLDRMADILVFLGTRRWPSPVRADEDGALRLVVRVPPYADLVALAFDQVRHFAADQAVVTVRILETLARIARRVPPRHHPCLRAQMQATLDGTRQRVSVARDLALVESAARSAFDSVGNVTA